MLQLHLKEFDISRISKLLVKYRIKASIANQTITLDGNISDELLIQLCDDVTICSVQNFSSEISANVSDSSEETKKVNHMVQGRTNTTLISQTMPDYDLIFSKVRYGEVYWCDLGKPFGSEQGYRRPVIVVQNKHGNIFSATTIVLPCTSKSNNQLPVHYSFTFSNENMINYNDTVPAAKNTVMAEQIMVIDKRRLRKFIGTMNDKFMEKIQKLINLSLNLTRPEKIITKTEKVYIEKPVYQNMPVDPNAPKEHKDLNIVQIKLLSLVNINELFEISKYSNSDEVKVQKIIKLFGFDIQKNGVQYLVKAILISPKDMYFNLDTLCENISKDETNVEKEEIKRLIVARVKEFLKFKKSPTIDFIRLVNRFLSKEDKNHESNI